MEFTSELELQSEYDKLESYTEVLSRYSNESPPRIRLVIANSGDVEYDVYLGFTPPFSQYTLNDSYSRNKLTIVPNSYPKSKDKLLPSTRIDNCWTSPDVPSILDTGKITTLQPEEQISDEYTILNHGRNLSCFPEGIYSNKDRIGIEDSNVDSELKLRISITESVM